MQNRKYSLRELSDLTDSILVGNPDHLISNVDGLESALTNDASFLSNPRYIESVKSSQAGVICVDRNTKLFEGKNYLISEDPSHVFQKIAEYILGAKQTPSSFEGIHEKAFVHESAEIGEHVTIAPGACIDRETVIGHHTIIGPNVSIGPGCVIGHNSHIHANVVIRNHSFIGNRVILQPGCIIGSCGFGYIINENGHHKKLNQLGIVIIEDDVEIGSNTTIDRARFKATIVRRGTKIDNLVQIGHNVELGEDNIIIAQTGIAGSTKTGRHVMVGGQCGIIGHVELADGVQLATRSGVSKSLKKPGPYRGSPAIPLKEYHKREVYIRQIEKLAKRIEALEKKEADANLL
ncbi:MAG: UDP-3-O-(3-hydroxymyristoyl)glucosamine N-acyltransferase [Simkaniaceae bacterium]